MDGKKYAVVGFAVGAAMAAGIDLPVRQDEIGEKGRWLRIGIAAGKWAAKEFAERVEVKEEKFDPDMGGGWLAGL